MRRQEAQRRRRESTEKAQLHQRSQETRGGRTGRGPRSSSTARFEYAGEAAAPPPPKAVLGDVLALAVDKHEGRNARSASELASAEDSREELEVRRAIAESIVLNSSLRVDAPVFVPAARAFTGRRGNKVQGPSRDLIYGAVLCAKCAARGPSQTYEWAGPGETWGEMRTPVG